MAKARSPWARAPTRGRVAAGANQTPSGLAALTKYLSRVDDRELEQLAAAARRGE